MTKNKICNNMKCKNKQTCFSSSREEAPIKEEKKKKFLGKIMALWQIESLQLKVHDFLFVL